MPFPNGVLDEKAFPVSKDSMPSNLKKTNRLSLIKRSINKCLLLAVIFTLSLGYKSGLDLPFLPKIPQPHLRSNGSTDMVQWDKYSLMIKGQRIFLWSGEFHPWRLPVPSLWPDVLQKIKASGMNAISVYVHWGLSNPAPGVLDFEGYRDWQPLLDAAKDAGLWVVLRPGPYINAETTAGGIPGWVTSQVEGHLRTNDSNYHDAWKPYIKAISEIARSNQITNGGPIIAVQVENEYIQGDDIGHPFKVEMMIDLEEEFREAGIVVPLTHNDMDQGNNYASGPGAVDIYGLDSYPQSFDCSHPEKWNNVTENYNDYHQKVNPDQPFYVPEFQSGAFDPWGPSAPGYDKCRILTGTAFQNVFNLHLWENNAKLINLYMLYGGTSWGHLPFPGVYTSYDYGAPIRESRELSEKYTNLKLQGMFLRSSPEFYKTDIIGNSSDETVRSRNPSVLVTYLRNPDSGAGFYFARKRDSTSATIETFDLTVTTSLGLFDLPLVTKSITLTGRASKLIVTDYKFGESSVLFSTASVFFSGRIGDRDVLYLYGHSHESHEAAIKFLGRPNGVQTMHVIQHNIAGYTLVSVLPDTTGLVTVWDSDMQLILYSDIATAGTFWAPLIANPSSKDPLRNFWHFGTNQTLLIGGPYLVREATLKGTKLALWGDLKNEVALTVIAPKGISSITWNDSPVEFVSSMEESTVLVGHLGVRDRFDGWDRPPPLNSWNYADSLPEVQMDFKDDVWTLANHTTTNSPYKPYFGDGPVLYGCDYGFCEGAVIWRGHFNSSGTETGVNLTINGGEAFAASVWLNGQFLKTTYGNSSNNQNIIRETNEVFPFPPEVLLPGQDNIITILQDNMGIDETENMDADTSKSPRGIRGYHLLPETQFSSWRVQGKQGGYSNFPDRVRGIMNEGGFFGERQGWHLPDLNTSASSIWTTRDFSAGLPDDLAGVGVFRTEFNLSIPEGYDVPMSFVFDDDDDDDDDSQTSQPYRALLFVNGWQMGKRVSNLGPQSKFPVHEGILDYRGKNTLAVILWLMESGHAVKPSVRLTFDAIYDGGPGRVEQTNPGWTDRQTT